MQLSAVRFSTIVITLTTQSTRCGSRTRRASVRSTVLLAIWAYVVLGCTCTNCDCSLSKFSVVFASAHLGFSCAGLEVVVIAADLLLSRLCVAVGLHLGGGLIMPPPLRRDCGQCGAQCRRILSNPRYSPHNVVQNNDWQEIAVFV